MLISSLGGSMEKIESLEYVSEAKKALHNLMDKLSTHPIYLDEYEKLIDGSQYRTADRLLREQDYVVKTYILGEEVVALSDGKRNRTKKERVDDIDYLISKEFSI